MEEQLWTEIEALSRANAKKEARITELEDDVRHLQANIQYLAPLSRRQRADLAQTTFRLLPLRSYQGWKDVTDAPPDGPNNSDTVYHLDACNRAYYDEADGVDLFECCIASLVVQVARDSVSLHGYRMVNGTLNRQAEIEVRGAMRVYCEQLWPQHSVTLEPVRHLDCDEQ